MFWKDVFLEDQKDLLEIFSFLITSLILQLFENILEHSVEQLYCFDKEVARFVTPIREQNR